MRKRQEGKLEVAELNILAFTLGLTNMEKIRNEYIRGKAQVEQLQDKVREEKGKWCAEEG